MGGKNSKPVDAPAPPVSTPSEAPTGTNDTVPSDDPLAGTPFALSGAKKVSAPAQSSSAAASAKPAEVEAPGGPAKAEPDTRLAPGEASEYHDKPTHEDGDLTTVDEAISRGYMPHYSKVIDPVETINPITGRSLFYAARPWRCDDRFQDWFATFIKHRRMDKVRETWGVLLQCARADYGKQPTVPYVSLERREIMYYVDRAEHDMIRDRFWQRYPWASREPVRTMLEDGSKMRVWRHQREMELEAKEGRVEDLIAGANHGTTTYGSIGDVVGESVLPGSNVNNYR